MSEPPITLTAVIPTLNDESVLGHTIERTLNGCGFDEVIVVDGGSSDGTVNIALEHDAHVLVTDPVRGRQLDDGWKAATTDLVCFLRADTRLPDTAGADIRQAFEDPDVTLTAFRLGYQSKRSNLALLAAWFNFRSILLGHPTGVQAITVRRSDLEALGGLPYWHECEDFYLIENMRRRGRTLTLEEHVYVPGDRALQKGVASVWWDDIRETLLYTRHKIPSYLRK